MERRSRRCKPSPPRCTEPQPRESATTNSAPLRSRFGIITRTVPASEPKDYQPVTDYLTIGELAGLLRRSFKYLFRPLPKIRIVRETPTDAPLVSVIIPTYNRSNVLRMAIHSVLYQTEQDFEVLVMGDGCTDDSEAVVKSIGDARIRWHNLPSNHGHQTAPMNAGLAMSRGRYIAILGHDDIWHADHLRAQIRAITAANAGASISGVEMRGPRRASYCVVTGLFRGGVYNPVICSPPSGLMFSREAYERVGPWQDYRTVWRNPECEFQYQAHLAGFQFVSTGELTVFKFPSILWKKAYINRPSGEQGWYLDRIQKTRWFQLKEALDIARVHLLKLPMRKPAIAAPPSKHTPGWEVSQFRKLRGLE